MEQIPYLFIQSRSLLFAWNFSFLQFKTMLRCFLWLFCCSFLIYSLIQQLGTYHVRGFVTHMHTHTHPLVNDSLSLLMAAFWDVCPCIASPLLSLWSRTHDSSLEISCYGAVLWVREGDLGLSCRWASKNQNGIKQFSPKEWSLCSSCLKSVGWQLCSLNVASSKKFWKVLIC